MLRIAQIGFGAWGARLTPRLEALRGARLATLCDVAPAALRRAAYLHPNVPLVGDWRVVIESPDIDAVVISSPPDTVFPLAMLAMDEGKHVLVERPMAETSGEMRRMIDAADRRSLVLMGGYAELFAPGVQMVRELLMDGELGTPQSCGAIRLEAGEGAPGKVHWHLAWADLAVLDHWFPLGPHAVVAHQIHAGPARTVRLTLFYPDGFVANLQVGHGAEVDRRRLVVGGTLRTAQYDELSPTEKVQIREVGNHGFWAPGLRSDDPIASLCKDFADNITRGQTPVFDGGVALRVLSILEAADRSLAAGGHTIEIARRGVFA